MLNSKAANLYRKQECARQTLCNTDPQRDQPLQTAWKSPVIQILWALTMAQSSMKVRAPALPHCLGYKAWLIQPNLSKNFQENKIIAPRPTRILKKRGPLPSDASHVRRWNPKKKPCNPEVAIKWYKRSLFPTLGKEANALWFQSTYTLPLQIATTKEAT